MSEQDEKQQQQSNQAVGGSGSADSRGVVALMVEVADALADDTRRPSLAVAVPGGKGERGDREKGRGRGMGFVYLFLWGVKVSPTLSWCRQVFIVAHSCLAHL